jgi:hypothetical protein
MDIMNTNRWILFLALHTLACTATSQSLGVGTSAPNPSAMLDVASTHSGILIPRMTIAQRDAIDAPAAGLLVFTTDNNNFSYYNGSAWTVLGGGGGGGGGTSSLLTDEDGNTTVDVEFTPNEDQIRLSTGGTEVMRINNNGQVGIGTDMPGGTLDVVGDVQAMLFIDRVSPQYYLDPGATSVSMSVAGSVKASLFSDASNASFYLDPASTGTSLKTAGAVQSTIYYDDATTTHFLDPANVGISLKVAGSADAATFRDLNNTSYLLDPASTSILNNLTINPTATGPGAGLRINATNGNYWHVNSIGQEDQDLGFFYNGASKAYLNWDVNVDALDYTAQHRSLPSEGDIEDYRDMQGYIVVSDGTISNLDGSTRPGINESLPRVMLSDRPNDKRIYGVISHIEEANTSGDGNYREYAQGAFVTLVERKDAEDYRIVINSAGEGGIWVSNYGGAIENGDLLTTSPIPGIGMKQADDLLRNYTVAKVVMDCDFDLHSRDYICKEVQHEGKTYRMAFLACVYQL